MSIEIGTSVQANKKKWIVYPWSFWKKIWDICMGGIKMYYCFAIPYYLGFSNHHEGKLIGLDFFFDILLFFDIILRLSTAFVKDAKLIDERKKILFNSLKNGIWIDLICVIPWYVVYNELMWFRVLRLLQIQSLKSALDKTVNFI